MAIRLLEKEFDDFVQRSGFYVARDDRIKLDSEFLSEKNIDCTVFLQLIGKSIDDNFNKNQPSWEKLLGQRLLFHVLRDGNEASILPYERICLGEATPPTLLKYEDNAPLGRVALIRHFMNSIIRMNHAVKRPDELLEYETLYLSGNLAGLADFLKDKPVWRSSPWLYDYEPTCRNIANSLLSLRKNEKNSLVLVDVEMLLPLPGNLMDILRKKGCAIDRVFF